MARFFDPSTPNDRALVRKTYKDNPDLDLIAQRAERDVLRALSVPVPTTTGWKAPYGYDGGGVGVMDQRLYELTGIGVATLPMGPDFRPEWGDYLNPSRWVALMGFKADPAACEASLRDTLRDVISDVTNWRLAQQGINPMVKVKSTERGHSDSYRDEALSPWLPEWDAPLESYRSGGQTGRVAWAV